MEWIHVFTIVGVNIAMILSAIGITITLYIHGDKKIDAIKDEMKEFHGRMEEFQGRLEKNDMEFKLRMERQDAEFKAAMLRIEERFRQKECQ